MVTKFLSFFIRLFIISFYCRFWCRSERRSLWAFSFLVSILSVCICVVMESQEQINIYWRRD